MKLPDDSIQIEDFTQKIRLGFAQLKDICVRNRRWINYEVLCDFAVEGVPTECLEWYDWWNYWKTRFDSTYSYTKRDLIFDELIENLFREGLLPGDIQGLTGNISSRIENIVNRGLSEKAD